MKTKVYRIPSTNKIDTLYVKVWYPEKTPVGVLQISHGMIEYIDRYDQFATYLAEQGFLVVGNDHLGHGYTAASEADLGYMNGSDASQIIVRDLFRVTKFIKKLYPEVPFYMLGHSMGSFLARRYAMSYGEYIDGLVVMGTGYQPRPILLFGYLVLALHHFTVGDRNRSRIVELLAFGSYNLKCLKDCTIHAWLTRDKDKVAIYEQDPFCMFKFTVKGYKTLFDTLWYIEKESHVDLIPKDLPVLFVSGTADPVGSYKKGVEKVVGQMKKAGVENMISIYYEGARHEILHELEYQKTYDDIVSWLKQKIFEKHN